MGTKILWNLTMPHIIFIFEWVDKQFNVGKNTIWVITSIGILQAGEIAHRHSLYKWHVIVLEEYNIGKNHNNMSSIRVYIFVDKDTLHSKNLRMRTRAKVFDLTIQETEIDNLATVSMRMKIRSTDRNMYPRTVQDLSQLRNTNQILLEHRKARIYTISRMDFAPIPLAQNVALFRDLLEINPTHNYFREKKSGNPLHLQ